MTELTIPPDGTAAPGPETRLAAEYTNHVSAKILVTVGQLKSCNPCTAWMCVPLAAVAKPVRHAIIRPVISRTLLKLFARAFEKIC